MVTYIIKDKSSGLYKIGKTVNFKRRFQTLSTSNINLQQILIIFGDEEKYLHQIYSNKHIKLEWYNLNQRDIDDIKEYIFDRDCI
jgi:hypothetical protein